MNLNGLPAPVKRWLPLTLVISLIWGGLEFFIGPAEDATVVEPVKRGASATRERSGEEVGKRTETARSHDQPASAGGLNLQALARRDGAVEASGSAGQPSAEGGDLFAAQSWQPPPPPPPPYVAPPPPPAPVAPPLPYTFMGGMTDGRERTVFLTRDNRVLTVKAGDTIDGAYRVDAIEDTQMKLTYLPLNQQQTMRTGGR